MQKRQIIINSIMSVLQILVISLVLFFLYQYLLKTIGAERFGIWSLVLATTAVTQIADLGLSGGIVKFVAKYIAKKEKKSVSGVIQTAVITIGITVGLVLIIGFPVIKWVLSLIIPQDSLHLAVSILPYAFLALWTCVVTSIFQSSLDGYQRFDLRSIILMGGAVFHLILCFLMVPKYGLMGLAYAKVIQNSSVLIASWMTLKRLLPSLPVIPLKWNKSLFKEMIGYSINFQVISIATMLYDPITKALLSKFGSLSMVGYYQMASKMIQKLHSLILAANQVLVPAFAELKEKTPEKIQYIYLTSYQLLFFLVFPLYSFAVVCLPFISKIWIGYYEDKFIVFASLLALGWLMDALASPAYHANLGIGKLRWNVVAHIATAISNIGLGIILGIFYQGTGVVIAWIFSLTLGSFIILISYHLDYKIPLKKLVPKASRINTGVSLAGLILVFFIRKYLFFDLSPIFLNIITIILFLSIIIIPFWKHPMRQRLIGWIETQLLKPKTK